MSPAPDRSILALDEALTAFSQVAPRQAKVVELRYFGGLTEEEIVAALKISPRTVRRDWDLAKAWLMRELSHTIQKTIGNRGHDSGAFPANRRAVPCGSRGSADQRVALLSQADPELRREVESLLAATGRRRISGSACDSRMLRNCWRDSTVVELAAGACLGRTVSKANSARAAWARSFVRSTRD